MVSIVSCLSGTALRGRIARKTLVGILQMIVLVSLTTNQTDAKKDPAVACNGTWLKHRPTCNDSLTVNVLNVTIGYATPCGHRHCCRNSSRCEVSAEEVELVFYQSVLAACRGRPHCLALQGSSNWTFLSDYCEDTDDGSSSGDTEDGSSSGDTEDGSSSSDTEDGSSSGDTEDGSSSGDTEDGSSSGDTDDGSSSSDEGGHLPDVYAKYVIIEYNCKRVPSASLPSPSWTTATEAPYDVTTDPGEASRRGSASDQVGVAVGVTVAVLVVVGVITAVLVIYFLRRRKKQMERQTGKDEMASHATPVPNSYDNAFYQEVIPSAPPPTPGGTTRDPPPLDPTASSGNPHPSSPGAAQDTDYDLVRSPYAKVQRPTSQDSEYDLRLMENPTYN